MSPKGGVIAIQKKLRKNKRSVRNNAKKKSPLLRESTVVDFHKS